MRLVECSITARTQASVPSSRSTVKKSQARIASARERRNCDQVIFVDHASDVSLFSDPVLVEVDRLG